MLIKLLLALMSVFAMLLGISVPTAHATQYGSVDIRSNWMTSIDYAKAMGAGWNLGNSFDGYDGDTNVADRGEEAWGNPKVTRDLIRAIKAKGFTNIRIPMTIDRRSTQEWNGFNRIDANWLKRYREVVDWAVDEGLYVMINIHHDSEWLRYWNGDTSDARYQRYVDYWNQMAQYFADEPANVCFETINEPKFLVNNSKDYTADKQGWLNTINHTAYNIIRSVPGNERRMVVIPSYDTSYAEEQSRAVQRFISDLNDPYVLATIHYYADWVYSANLGRTNFDEDVFPDCPGYTPRTAIDEFADRMDRHFTANGIGLVIGEYGLLAYDSSSEGALQTGEEAKYYEYVNHISNTHGFARCFWDNGSGIDRTTFQWKKPQTGKTIEQGIYGRSSYAKGLDTIYLHDAPNTDIRIPLNLNGHEFLGITGLNEWADYTYDANTTTVTLKSWFVAGKYWAKNGRGVIADLEFNFNWGPSWHEYLVSWDWAYPKAWEARPGSMWGGFEIPVAFNGNEVKSVQAFDEWGNRVGSQAGWWNWLQNSEEFEVHYGDADRRDGMLTLKPGFFYGSGIGNGKYTLKVQCHTNDAVSGQSDTIEIPFAVNDGRITLG